MNESNITEDVFDEAQKNWGWLLFLGIVMIVLGTAGLYMSEVLTISLF